jgi:putative acetyltransferase
VNFRIQSETVQAQRAIWNLNKQAFGGDAEANLVDALRDGGFVEVSLMAVLCGEVVGHILFSRVAINTTVGKLEALSLAPMAVSPDYQGRGIGSQLVKAGLESCRERSHKIVLVLGDPEFYRRFGFSSELARNLASPFGDGQEWMALELVPSSLSGVVGEVEYSPPFAAFE